MTWFEWCEWWLLLHRAGRDPSGFLERAAWHLWEENTFASYRAGGLLYDVARFVHRGAEPPSWLVPGRTTVKGVCDGGQSN